MTSSPCHCIDSTKYNKQDVHALIDTHIIICIKIIKLNVGPNTSLDLWLLYTLTNQSHNHNVGTTGVFQLLSHMVHFRL